MNQLSLTISPLQIACLLVVAIATIIDLRTKKIPNWLTLSASLLAMVMQYLHWHSFLGLLWAAEGWLTGFFVTLAVQLLPMLTRNYKKPPIGYGDTKLIAAIGAFLDAPHVLRVFFYFCLFYILLALVHVIKAIDWKQAKLLFTMPAEAATNPLLMFNQQKLSTALKSYIALTPAIALATIVTIFF
jgi:prepilin peptidase CpaA